MSLVTLHTKAWTHTHCEVWLEARHLQMDLILHEIVFRALAGQLSIFHSNISRFKATSFVNCLRFWFLTECPAKENTKQTTRAQSVRHIWNQLLRNARCLYGTKGMPSSRLVHFKREIPENKILGGILWYITQDVFFSLCHSYKCLLGVEAMWYSSTSMHEANNLLPSKSQVLYHLGCANRWVLPI